MLHIWTSLITIKRNYVGILYKKIPTLTYDKERTIRIITGISYIPQKRGIKNKPTALYTQKETGYKKVLKIEDKFPSEDEIRVYKICTHHGLRIYASNDILSWKVELSHVNSNWSEVQFTKV
jgi:hypothetical protein